MFYKNILNLSGLLIVAVVLASCTSTITTPPSELQPAISEQPSIQIIYPKPGQTIGAVDSTFILGNISNFPTTRYFQFTINETKVPVHKDGGFIAFLPIEPGEFVFRMQAKCSSCREDLYSIEDSLVVNVPAPIVPLEADSLVIQGDFRPPDGDLTMRSGEMLNISFRGTTGCRAYCSIPGVVDSIPMAESAPVNQPFWGTAVFGQGSVPDSMLMRGIYTGRFEIPLGVRADSVRLVYHLIPPDQYDIFWRLMDGMLLEYDRLIKYLLLPDSAHVTRESNYQLTLNDPEYPFTVIFTDSAQTIRHAPRKGYFSIFQPEGILAEVVGSEGEWYKLKLSETQYAYALNISSEKTEAGIQPVHSLLKVVRLHSFEDHLTIEFPLSGKHAYRVIEENRRSLRIQLFGVTTDTDWIRYDFSDSMIDLATWTQPEPSMYEFKIDLNHDIWGYDCYYEGNTLVLSLKRPPSDLNSLQGKIIVIDPGHSGDPGSIGPTGLTEAEANLGISLVLRDMLESKGAKVIMTRTDTSHVPLYDRPSIAKENNADLYVSIHNNALPDGVNPFENNGVSAYYYHPHSIDLARAIHAEMIVETGLPDHGLTHGNLAVIRPTQYPAVLIECAFMIIPEQEAMLKTNKFRKTISKAITKGIENFLKEFAND